MKLGTVFFVFFVLSVVLFAKPFEPVKHNGTLIFDIPVATPNSSRYVTGWLKLFEQPQPKAPMKITPFGDAGCKLEIESPLSLYDDNSRKVTSSNIEEDGTLTSPEHIQYIYFTYRNSGHAPNCRVRVTVGKSGGGTEPTWSDAKIGDLAKKAEGDFLFLSSRMNLLEAERKADYSAVETEKTKLREELTRFVELCAEKPSETNPKDAFSSLAEAALDFEGKFSSLHKNQKMPAKVAEHWKSFSGTFLSLAELFVDFK